SDLCGSFFSAATARLTEPRGAPRLRAMLCGKLASQHVIGTACLILGVLAAPANAVVGFLSDQPPAAIPSVETDTACELAKKLVGATPVAPNGDLKLDGFAAVWCHQGEATLATSLLFRAEVVAALSNYVAAGHGLLLSGTAAALVNALGVDKARYTPVVFGHDRAQAGLVPVAAGHPALRGLDLDRGVAWMTCAVYPAFASFHATQGTLLAKTPGGPENPLLEYRLGKGRIIVCGWRLSPLYYDAPRSYRDNFERLIGNTLLYLREGQPWEPTLNAPPPAVAESEWEAMALAIADLSDTFKTRYPRGAEFRERLARLRQAPTAQNVADEFRRLRSEALLANPLLDFEKLLLIKRGANKLGLPQNYTGNSTLEPAGYDNEIAVLSSVRTGGKLGCRMPASVGR
ncbi:MAG: hypothetical protein NTY53_00500, partial [Kiritimatiellaeota bacterium]|nr:hypothetical protein [Kiritimatiellota bacterium]